MATQPATTRVRFLESVAGIADKKYRDSETGEWSIIRHPHFPGRETYSFKPRDEYSIPRALVEPWVAAGIVEVIPEMNVARG